MREASRNVVALRRDERASTSPLVSQARTVFLEQAAVIAQLAERVDNRFTEAIEILFRTEGHVVVFGVGKSGLIGKKIASTLASTGTPSFFVHAAEAYHGDLGMITERDSVILISRSGETEEVVRLLPHLRRTEIPMIGLVGDMDSTLACGVDVALDVSVDREACPNNLAPTNSTLAALSMGDALSVALSRVRGFRACDFARFHPGGSLGQRLLTRVRDTMRKADLPFVSPTDTVGDTLVTMTSGRMGLALVMRSERLVGIITDGDLRRSMQRHDDLLSMPVSEIMTLNPVTIDEDVLLADAHHRMQNLKLKALVAVNGEGKVTGVVEVFDEK